MARLFRPAIPVKVKCRVLLRQLGEMFPDTVIVEHRRGLGRLAEALEARLAEMLLCTVNDLRIDHDPALALRSRSGEGKATVYDPPANDPEFLAYRPHGTEFAGSHDVKTRIRGDGAQFSDLALIKRQRRREKKAAEAKQRNKRQKFAARRQKIRGRWKWPKRSFPTRSK